MVLPILACVAAITLAACSTSTTAPISALPSVSATVTTTSPDLPELTPGADTLVLYGTSQTSDRLVEAARLLDLRYMVVPIEALMMLGYVGVGPLGESCIFMLSIAGAETDKGLISAMILPRFDATYGDLITDATYGQLKGFIDRFRSDCKSL